MKCICMYSVVYICIVWYTLECSVPICVVYTCMYMHTEYACVFRYGLCVFTCSRTLLFQSMYVFTVYAMCTYICVYVRIYLIFCTSSVGKYMI